MHFSKDLYISDNLISRRDQVCRAIKYGERKENAYILLKSSKDDFPELINAKFLKQKYYLENPAEIVGITETYEEGLAYLTVLALVRYNK